MADDAPPAHRLYAVELALHRETRRARISQRLPGTPRTVGACIADAARPRVSMFEHFPERRRYIRSRADLEFQLARITLALSRAPMARRVQTLAWLDEAGDGLVAKAATEHRDYVAGRVAEIRETFFGEPSPLFLRPRATAFDGPSRLQ